MRVPVSWLRALVALPADVPVTELAERLTAAGLTVETIDRGTTVTGRLVVGRVLSSADEPQKNGKTIRWCSLDTGDGEPRGVVCGAHNFAVDDLVVVALPGTVLPGGVPIGARKTYGHVSDGMICSARELGIGEDAAGIIVLGSGTDVAGLRPGADATPLLGLGEDVLDIAVTTDRGYALSMRGMARETATAYGLAFRDPAELAAPGASDGGHPVRVEDPAACPVFVARTVRGIDPAAVSPPWLQQRLRQVGMRSVSLVVDITNFVMFELGQPIHAYDAARLQGPIAVRRARPSEQLTTLDGRRRELDADDLLITDDSGPIGLAGVMGGASTEVSATTTDVVIEAACFAAGLTGLAARRHGLPSEASRRFERGVDPALAPAAAQRVVDLLVELGGAVPEAAATVVGAPPTPATITMPVDLPQRLVGVALSTERVTSLLAAVGATVSADGDLLVIVAPTWRPDLLGPADLVEEVARLNGYDAIPSILPVAPAGRGWTPGQRARRRIGIALAEHGYVEAPSYPFVGLDELDALGLPPEDARRQLLRLANPLSEQQPYLRSTLLPGLLATLRRNIARGATDIALFEEGLVVRPGPTPLPPSPRLPVDRRPTPDEVAALEAALPGQPRRIAVALAGRRQRQGWWGAGEPVSWADAVEAGRLVATAAGVALEIRADEHAPWHPGRCAELLVDGRTVGHAGELHPRVTAALGLPERVSAMEIDVDLLGVREAPLAAPHVSAFPPATQDVALVVDAAVPAAEVEEALREGAGDLLEEVRLFDVYTGEQVGAGRRSLAYALRFRAPDRTLRVEEASAARDAAVAAAGRRTGAELRRA